MCFYYYIIYFIYLFLIKIGATFIITYNQRKNEFIGALSFLEMCFS